MDEGNYKQHFQCLTSFPPYDYQVRVAQLLFDRRNVVLRAPTGAGKTWAVIAPFLYNDWPGSPARLIYALPLRTLAQGVYREAREAASKIGVPVDGIVEGSHEVVPPFVTLQTGEQPDDPFFDRGRIIVTTYDQLLSGLLCGPYSLSSRLHNVNAAAVAGALVVFDEFHLMPPDKAFLTAAAGLRLFGDLCQSVWMTATATKPLEKVLSEALNAAVIPEDSDVLEQLMLSLPSVNSVTRTLIWESHLLTAEAVLAAHQYRTIALTNTVGRAQDLFRELRTRLADRPEIQRVLLHSRFFKGDRQQKERSLKALFGPGSKGSAILVATQVIEAGIDISCEHLHTELCPMNALIQRAGRCARFPGEQGTVHVYDLPPDRGWLPYGTLQGADPSVHATRDVLMTSGHRSLDPIRAAEWVEAVHCDEDDQAVRSGVKDRTNRFLEAVHQNAIERNRAGIAHLIRGDNSESIRVIVCAEPHLPQSPGKMESVSMSRWSLAQYLSPSSPVGWYWNGDELAPWKVLARRSQLADTYAIALSPRSANYDDQVGLRIGEPGIAESRPRAEPPRPGYAPLREETWINHARKVAESAEARLARDGFPSGRISFGFENLFGLNAECLRIAARACGILHDLGKLQARWQQWASAWQSSRNSSYEPTVPLAHTNFDADDPEDRKRQQALIRRPPHATASAYYSWSLLEALLNGVPDELMDYVKSACTASIIAHHGAFIPKAGGMGLGILEMSKVWEEIVGECVGYMPDRQTVQYLLGQKDRRGHVTEVLRITTSRDALEKWWPLVSYLKRTLRLSDQRATSEWACSA